MNSTMEQNIKNRDFIFIIATSRFKQRAEENIVGKPNNLQFELGHILESNKPVLPILWDGGFSISFPTNYSFKNNLVYDFTKINYFKLLVGTVDPKGIIPTLLHIHEDTVYNALVEPFFVKYNLL